MTHSSARTTYRISRPQDVIDIVNANSALRSNIGIVLIALGGILIDAYQAAMVGFGNKYIAAEFGISPGLAATVNASVLIAALIGGLLANRVINTFGQRKAFLIGMGMCTWALPQWPLRLTFGGCLLPASLWDSGWASISLWRPALWLSFAEHRRRSRVPR